MQSSGYNTLLLLLLSISFDSLARTLDSNWSKSLSASSSLLNSSIATIVAVWFLRFIKHRRCRHYIISIISSLLLFSGAAAPLFSPNNSLLKVEDIDDATPTEGWKIKNENGVLIARASLIRGTRVIKNAQFENGWKRCAFVQDVAIIQWLVQQHGIVPYYSLSLSYTILPQHKNLLCCLDFVRNPCVLRGR